VARYVNKNLNSFYRALAAQFLRHYLPKDVTADFDLRTLERVKDSFVSEDLRHYFSDLIFRLKLKSGDEVYVYILLEHKSAPEKWVAFQLLGYQMKFWEQAKEAGSERLPLVIPVVVYHGRKPWNISRNFQDLIAGSERMEWRRFVPSFEYYLCDLSRYADDEIVGGPELTTGLLLLKYIFRREFGERLEEIVSPLKELPEAERRKYFLPIAKYVSSAAVGMKPEQMREKLAAAFPERKGVNMQTVAEIWKQEGLEKGLQMGLEQGGQMAAAEMAMQLLEHRFGQISERAKRQILRLPLAVLKELGGVLLDFATPADLTAWLREHKPEPKAGISSRGVSV